MVAFPRLNPLLIPELFQCILDSIDQTPTDRMAPHLAYDDQLERRRALVALAQTCRTTSEPSIECIWRVLSSLEPLVWCSAGFPKHHEDEDDFDEEYLPSDYSASMSLDELEEMIPPSPSEWDIIRRYSHRVREVKIDASFSLRFLRCIGTQPSPLFPNLRKLYWSPYVDQLRGSAALIQPLLGPSLIDLTATLTDEDDPTLISFLNSYHLQCPNLKTISFDFVWDDSISPTTLGALSRAICRHENLESIRVHGPIDATALSHLALSPTLKVIALVHHPRLTNPRVNFQPEEIPFLPVEHLHLTTSDLDFVASLLRPHHQIFHSFRLDLTSHPSSEAISAFFSVLVSGCLPHKMALRDLHFDFAGPTQLATTEPTAEDVALYCLSYGSFHPLTSLTFLRELRICSKYLISLDDSELAAMASSWPTLQILHFECRCGIYAEPVTKYPTLKGLLDLISSCPDLQSLSLPLDARVVPTDGGIDVVNTAIHTLRFLESPVIHAQPVAEFLSKHFPSVTSVSSTVLSPLLPSSQQQFAYNGVWLEVSSYMRSLQSQRE